MLLNEGGDRRHAIAFRLIAGQDRRTVLGTKIVVEAGESRQIAEWEIQPSFASGSAAPLWFGTGERAIVDRVTVLWPDGSQAVHEGLEAAGVWKLTPGEKPRLEHRFASTAPRR